MLISSDPCEAGRDYWCKKEPQYTTMENLHYALLNCPNITALDLHVTMEGCSEWPSRYTFPFNPLGGDTYPNLTTLRLRGYAFRPRRWPNREDWYLPRWGRGWQVAKDGKKFLSNRNWLMWLRWRMSPARQRNKSNLQLWMDAMDWSGIEELALDDVTDEIVEKLSDRLTALTSLEVANISLIEKLPKNLLKNLTWVAESSETDLPMILARHGESLESLEFRCDEGSCSTFDRDFKIPPAPKALQNLRHLSINVPRNETALPLDFVANVASIPSLRTADLWLKLQSACREQYMDTYTREHWRRIDEGICQGEEQYRKPYITDTTALQMFEHMIDKNKSVGGRLSNVTFWVGDWAPRRDGPAYEPGWFDGQQAKVVCWAGEKNHCETDIGKEYWVPRYGKWD